ncbi:nucleolar protein 4-like b isoform X3 [Chiloscyllium plagiosum]|uniref:nucleolar protein 4-like b isoform X3 n=1 Tax=Chiloscyllium plagiosum TaxID=36176 RepID=UPI001CB80225|nr:nucleolar protein 4-like b isoform X3 [Chiloscyllium plagiosum]
MANKAIDWECSGDRDMYSHFQDWCLRTYGDSGKTKTVTRKKYDRIVQLLSGVELSSVDNAKFKFWVKSKGFQLGMGDQKKGAAGKPAVYVPVKTTTGDGVTAKESISLKRVAVVEDFFDIIYSMHVETGTETAKTAKHAGQKRTYKAIAETYAFLPREAVTRFLMSCTECQKRMHINPNGVDSKENERPSSLAGVIDYNMPITATYLKQMKLQFMSTPHHLDESSVSSDDFDMSDATWISADQCMNSDLSPSQEERMHSPQNLHNQEYDDSSSECYSGNGSTTLNPATSNSTQGDSTFPEINGNSSTGLDYSAGPDDQPVNLSERLQPGQMDNGNIDGQRNRVKYTGKTTSDVRLNRDTRDYGNKTSIVESQIARSCWPVRGQQPLGPKDCWLRPIFMGSNGKKSPPYSSGSYDSSRNELSGSCPEDLSISRGGDDDDDDHDDHEDSEKINDSEGMDPERLKAFNMFVRLFVDENLDRMVPISKQPKEKIQAIIESCSRQFPEFQERARKRIRTYLKSCRRMKKNGIELASRLHASSFRQEDREEGASNFFMTAVAGSAPSSTNRKRACWRSRPTPPHLTSAMAENILAAACESESRKAAKRMRLEAYQVQDEPIALDKHTQQTRETAQLAHNTYSLPAASYSQDQMYINGGLNYSYRGYGGIGGGLQTGTLSNGPTDLSMKALASNSASSNTNNRSVPAAQLSPTEINAVRQLIAGYRESAAFLLRSADELENLILQQN